MKLIRCIYNMGGITPQQPAGVLLFVLIAYVIPGMAGTTAAAEHRKERLALCVT